jgi:Tol biopolymer transport system component
MRRLEGENAPQVMLLVDVADGSQRTLVPPPPSGAVSGPAWSGDGRSLIFGQLASFVFTNVSMGTARIVRQEVGSSRAETLMWIPSPAGAIDILGPGCLLMNIRSQRANLMEVPLGGSSGGARGRWLTRGSSTDRQPAVSPDGRWVISSSNRAGNLDLWKLSLTDGSLRRVTEDAADDWDPAFTPDGRNILWSSSRSGHFEIWMCDVDGTGARQVTNDGFDAENPTMTPDGRWIVYSSSNPRHSGVWKIHPDGSGALLLVPGAWSTPEVSPDGLWVAFRTQVVPRVLHIARIEDGEVQPYPSELPGGLFTARPRWMPGGRALAFTALDGAGEFGVFVQNFVPGRDARATRRALSTFDPGLAVESFGIAPDGSRVIYSLYERSTALMLAEGLPGIAPPSRPSR